MKNSLLGLVLMLVLLPQLSFGANLPSVVTNPQLTAFVKQQDSDSVAFFQKQADERAHFMKGHADIIAKMDEQGKALMAYKNAQSHQGFGFAGNSNAPPPAVVDSTYSAFMQHQLSDKQAFLAKQAQEKQSFLNSQAP